MTAHPFKDLVDNLDKGNGKISAFLPSGWRQGRTAFGGVTSAVSYMAARHVFEDLPPLRSFQTTFVGPVGDHPVFIPTLLRQGKNVTSVGVDVTADGQIVGRTTLIFGRSRESALTETLTAPDANAPEDTAHFVPPEILNTLPGFIRNFDTRLIEGSLPVSGASEGYIRIWCRHIDSWARDRSDGFICLGDILPPAALPMFNSFGPMSSVNWQMNIIEPDLPTQDGWWHIETRLSAARDGYSSQIMRYWNMQGRLVAEAIQTVAIFI